jgi:hypothetical protein
VKTTVIQLESYDDVTSARDKMAWCRSGRILFVFPEDYKVLERRVDLSLLKRFSVELGVQLGIVSNDTDVQANAREAGIPLFQSTVVAQKIPWRRTRHRHKLFESHRSSARLAELQDKARNHSTDIFCGRAARIGILAVAILSITALIGYFLPSATISLPEIRKEQVVDLSVWASPSIPSPVPAGGLPAFVTSVIVEGQDEAPASGQVITPDAAAIGYIKFSNLTTQEVQVAAGTTVVAINPGNVRFEVLQQTIVPAGFGQVAFAQVQALEKGIRGNVDAGEIAAVEGSLGLQLAVTNLGPTQGGEDRKAASPTQSDYQILHDRLLQALVKNAEVEFQKKLTNAEQLIPGSISLKTVLLENIEPAIGQPADSLHLSMQAEFSSWSIHLADLAKVENFALDASLPAGMAGLGAAPQSTNLSTPQFDQDTVRWNVRASRSTRQVWNRDSIVAQVIGKNQTGAAKQLAEMLGSSVDFRIENQPAWWPFLPGLSFRITVVNQ